MRKGMSLIVRLDENNFLNFSLKKVVSLSRGHVVGNTHLYFGFKMDGLNYRASLMQSSLLELLRRSR